MVETVTANPIVAMVIKVVAVTATAIPSVVINLSNCDHIEECDRSF